MNLLDRIRTLCNQHGISIPTLEKATRIGNGTVGRWDTSYPRADKLRDVADYFSVSMDWLMGRTLCGYSAEALEIARAFDSADDKSRALVRLALIEEIKSAKKDGA